MDLDSPGSPCIECLELLHTQIISSPGTRLVTARAQLQQEAREAMARHSLRGGTGQQ